MEKLRRGLKFSPVANVYEDSRLPHRMTCKQLNVSMDGAGI